MQQVDGELPAQAQEHDDHAGGKAVEAGRPLEPVDAQAGASHDGGTAVQREQSGEHARTGALAAQEFAAAADTTDPAAADTTDPAAASAQAEVAAGDPVAEADPRVQAEVADPVVAADAVDGVQVADAADPVTNAADPVTNAADSVTNAADSVTNAADLQVEPVDPESRAGAGGDWQTIDEQPGGAVGQLKDDSCVSACGEMVSGRSQQELIDAIQDPGSWGAGMADLAAELGDDWKGGYVGDHPQAAQVLNTTGPWVAEFKTFGARPHAVVVDGTDAEGRMMIRDPWDGGTNYRMTGEEFSRVWNGVAVYNPTRTREST
ncbi:papain-like cysteine protease family protein [Dactylosporangium sp. NPDC050688]|uniref:papain-like cysteine protease family protein n=1 Tax=Dactylosporangium sp. NPDC050688 TaxID=3157217 RepID=UPI0033E05343